MKNCVFCQNANKCGILTIKKCTGCRFAKTIEELKYGRINALNRIKSLPLKQLEYITNKYYKGVMITDA